MNHCTDFPSRVVVHCWVPHAAPDPHGLQSLPNCVCTVARGITGAVQTPTQSPYHVCILVAVFYR